MERFVRLLVAGGFALVTGLWLVEIARPGASPWLAGLVAAVAGSGAILAGIATELEI